MTLSNVGAANLAVINAAHTFTLDTLGPPTPDKWTGVGTLGATGAGAGATVIATRDANFTLVNGSLSATDGLNIGLSNVGAANLTVISHPHSFTLDNVNGSDHWTGTGSLTAFQVAGTVVVNRDADFFLANGSLSTLEGVAQTPGMSMTLSGITVANLLGATHAHTFTLNNAAGTDLWTGTGTLTSNVTGSTIRATGAAGFTLTNTKLSSSSGLSMTLVGAFGTANLTDTAGNQTFDVSGWTAAGTLANTSSPQVGDTVVAVKAGGFTLTNTSLIATDGLTLMLSGLFNKAQPDRHAGRPDLRRGRWTHGGTLANTPSDPADKVVAVKAAGYTLTNTSLSSTDGMGVTLSGPFTTANLTDTAGGNTFNVSGWTHSGKLTNTTNNPVVADNHRGQQAGRLHAGQRQHQQHGRHVADAGGRFNTANVTDTQGGHTFDVSTWTGNVTINNASSSPARAGHHREHQGGGLHADQHQPDQHRRPQPDAGGPFSTANLTDTAGGNTFTVTGWTGTGTLTGGSATRIRWR